MIQTVIGTKTNGRQAWLDAPAAASYARMLAAEMPAGGITDAGRTYAEQAALYADYLAGRLQATAAKPGTSRHESGLALDVVTSSGAQVWLIAHGAEHGWSRPLLHAAKPEPWHWEYTASADRHLADIPPIQAPAPNLTPPTLSQEDDMVELVKLLYATYYGRTPSGPEVLYWTDLAASSRLDAKALHALFRGSKADAGTVTAAYAYWLGRKPSAVDISSRAGLTVDQVWTAVQYSPEAKARRGEK